MQRKRVALNRSSPPGCTGLLLGFSAALLLSYLYTQESCIIRLSSMHTHAKTQRRLSLNLTEKRSPYWPSSNFRFSFLFCLLIRYIACCAYMWCGSFIFSPIHPLNLAAKITVQADFFLYTRMCFICIIYAYKVHNFRRE